MACLWWTRRRFPWKAPSKLPHRRPNQIRPVCELLEDRLALSGDPLALLQADVMGVAEAAAQRWIETGLSESQVEALHQIEYHVRDLGGSKLALAERFRITIDDNAAGHLWFVDQTIDLEEEFSAQSPTLFVADAGTLADGKMDLLTVVIHEQGHVLGLEGVLGIRDDAMNEALEAGVRRLPTFGQAENSIPGSLTNIQYLTSDATGGGQPFSTIQPYNTLNYVIALQGLFPSRNLSGSPFLGSVEMFAGNFAPRGYALAQGQLLPISTNQALFSILGTTYGGDGRTTFALPDLRGRVPIGAGVGPDGVDYQLGQQGGAENVTLTTNNLASHTHTVPGSSADTSATGGGATFENRQPYLVLNAIVNLVGLFPSRSFSSDELLGSVNWFAGNFAPRNTAFAQGQTLSIAGNTALFSLLGTTYGGDGRTTFGLPDLSGRMAIHAGSGPGLSTVRLGEKSGTAKVTPTASILPSHTHGIPGSLDSTGATGGGQSFDNRAPYLGLNYAISLVGIYPSRNLDTNESTDGGVDPVIQGFLSGDEVLGDEEARLLIAPVIETAIGYWQAAGIDDAQVDKLLSTDLEFADLSSGRLASAGKDVITLDRDAANRGWFIDVTPENHIEFAEVDTSTGELVATEEGAYYHFDLLTAILHEQGHILGLNHSEAASPGDIMYGGLQVGSRKLPKASDLAQSRETHAEEVHFLEADPLIASVGMFAGNFAPRGWALTNGQLLSISSNQALFSLLGTIYGGDGRVTFGLPELRGRAVVGTGTGPGLSNYREGQRGGAQSVTLTINQMPSHTHEYFAAVEGRFIAYNMSAFDGNNAIANAADDNAIAPDKVALLPGQTATFANYTSYSKGINEIIVDINLLAGMPTAADFEFAVGNDNNPAGWTAAPAPASIVVRAGAGTSGSDRVHITWANHTIEKEWLQVTVKATANTGLATDDVFYFGNAPGESGNSAVNAQVNATDQAGARDNPHNAFNPAGITDVHDHNRDTLVNATDQVIARDNFTNAFTDLNLITVPAIGRGVSLVNARDRELELVVPSRSQPSAVTHTRGAVDSVMEPQLSNLTLLLAKQQFHRERDVSASSADTERPDADATQERDIVFAALGGQLGALRL